MRNFIITLLALSAGMCIAENVFAGNLYDLYSDNYASQTTTAKQKSKTKSSATQYNGTYMPNYSSNNDAMKTLSGNTNALMKKGSENHGQYAKKKKDTINIDNPYTNLNNSYKTTQSHAKSSTVTYDGDAVKFKKGADGNLYGYNKFGKRIGIYKVNSNGTTTQYDTKGNNMGTFK